MSSSPPDPGRPATRERLSAVVRVTGRGAASAGRATARVTGRAGRGTARATSRVGRATGRFSRFTFLQARRAANAEGAGDTGLAHLIELGALNAAADAAVAISLAGTLFFQVPTGEARGQVSLFLGLTMLPFAIVAPLIGPFLDRFSHGRRWAIGATMALRAFLCWVLADAVVTQSVWLFPAALGVLVASKAYNVTRAAAVPRLVPEGVTLVRANARTSLAGVVGAAVSAPIAGLASAIGPSWSLRYAFLVFVLATIVAIRLPPRVDSAQGEDTMVLLGGRRNSARIRIPAAVAVALRANCGPRWLSGFLTMFMAFLLRANPIGDWSPQVLLGVVIGAAGMGQVLGIAAASLLRRADPTITVLGCLAGGAAMTVLTALVYGVLPLALLGLTAGLTLSLAKLSLDSTIQRDVPERVQTSAFARSDTTLQLAWVLGGFVGIALPLDPHLGLSVASVVLVTWTFVVLAGLRRRHTATTPRRAEARPERAERT